LLLNHDLNSHVSSFLKILSASSNFIIKATNLNFIVKNQSLNSNYPIKLIHSRQIIRIFQSFRLNRKTQEKNKFVNIRIYVFKIHIVFWDKEF